MITKYTKKYYRHSNNKNIIDEYEFETKIIVKGIPIILEKLYID